MPLKLILTVFERLLSQKPLSLSLGKVNKILACQMRIDYNEGFFLREVLINVAGREILGRTLVLEFD